MENFTAPAPRPSQPPLPPASLHSVEGPRPERPRPPLFRSRRRDGGPAWRDAGPLVLGRGTAAFVIDVMDLLSTDLEAAEGWADLAVRLARRGYAVRVVGTRTVLVRMSDRRDLCGTADLGHSHVALAERFGVAHPCWRRPHRAA